MIISQKYNHISQGQHLPKMGIDIVVVHKYQPLYLLMSLIIALLYHTIPIEYRIYQTIKKLVCFFIFSNTKQTHITTRQHKRYSQLGITPISLQPFFGGEALDKRMEYLRQHYIQPTRQKYNQQYFQQNMAIFQQKFPTLKPYAKDIVYRYWDDPVNEDKPFNLITMLTDEEASNTVLALVRDILRSNFNVEDKNNQQLIRFAIFFIQAVNIQLYQLTKKRKQLNNFTGTVFRAMTVSICDFGKFQILDKQRKLSERFISVPLSLWSSSKCFQKALKFLQYRNAEGIIRLMLKINVIELDKQDLQIYNKYFPESIVSTICAVDISDKQLSLMPEEEEVMLRGSFCLVLDIKLVTEYEVDFYEIDCVMTNANRDHISTNLLGQKSKPARDLFNLMNKIARLNFAIKYYSQTQTKLGMDEQHRKKQQYFKNLAIGQILKYQEMKKKMEQQLGSKL